MKLLQSLQKPIEIQEQVISPWVTVVAKTITASVYKTPQTFHSLKLNDYVAILAVTTDGKVPLVKQYRPAVDTETLELPAGMLELGEDPAAAATRELFEETGVRSERPVQCLGAFHADTGRLSNKQWGFFLSGAHHAASEQWAAEDLVERIFVTPQELRAAIEDGRFSHSMHIAIVGLAVMRGLFL